MDSSGQEELPSHFKRNEKVKALTSSYEHNKRVIFINKNFINTTLCLYLKPFWKKFLNQN